MGFFLGNNVGCAKQRPTAMGCAAVEELEPFSFCLQLRL
jgi:hypothetical protein